MDYDLIVVKTLERVYKNYYYIIRGEFLLALVKQFADEITGNCDSKYHKCTFQNNMSYHLSFPPFPSKPLFLLWISGNIQVLFQAARLSEQGQGSLKQSCTDIPLSLIHIQMCIRDSRYQSVLRHNFPQTETKA